MGAPNRPFLARLGLIVAGAAAFRVAFVLIARADRAIEGPTDEFWYWHQANLLADGHFFVNPFAEFIDGSLVPSAGHPPGYTVMLALPSLVGLDTSLSHRLFTALAGAVLVGVLGLLAREIAGDRAGLIAAGLAAIYPHLWNNDAVIGAETLFGLLVACALLAVYVYWRRPTLPMAALFTALLTAGALTRSEGAMLLPFIALPAIVFAPGPARALRIKALGVAAAVGLVLAGPWVIRNMVTFDRPSFIVTGSGHVIAYANCDATYSGRLLGYWADECALKDWPEGDESVVDAAAREKGLDYAREHLSDQPVVVAARVGRLWDVYRPFQNIEFNDFFERKGLWPSRLGLAGFYVLMPFAIHGLYVMRNRKLPIFPFLGVAAMVTISAAVSFGITRYRSPVDVLLPVAAAVSIDALWRAYRQRHTRAVETEAPDETRPPALVTH